MKTFLFKVLKSIAITLGFIGISLLMLKILGEFKEETMKLVASIYSMYGFPIILGNILLLSNGKSTLKNKPRLLTQIFKSVLLSMGILFVVNFVLWILIWGAPFADLFTERNLIFYLIGFCNLLVISIVFHTIASRLSTK